MLDFRGFFGVSVSFYLLTELVVMKRFSMMAPRGIPSFFKAGTRVAGLFLLAGLLGLFAPLSTRAQIIGVNGGFETPIMTLPLCELPIPR